MENDSCIILYGYNHWNNASFTSKEHLVRHLKFKIVSKLYNLICCFGTLSIMTIILDILAKYEMYPNIKDEPTG